jgi:hypothetical protein
MEESNTNRYAWYIMYNLSWCMYMFRWLPRLRAPSLTFSLSLSQCHLDTFVFHMKNYIWFLHVTMRHYADVSRQILDNISDTIWLKWATQSISISDLNICLLMWNFYEKSIFAKQIKEIKYNISYEKQMCPGDIEREREKMWVRGLLTWVTTWTYTYTKISTIYYSATPCTQYACLLDTISLFFLILKFLFLLQFM